MTGDQLLTRVHELWNEIGRTDDPQTRKHYFDQLAEIEKQITETFTHRKQEQSNE
jgi:hypothetical protein